MNEDNAITVTTPVFQMPEVFQEPTDKIVGQFRTPYIVFAHKNRGDEYAKLVGQFGMVSEGEMFLFEPEKITKLDVAKLGLIKARQFWCQKNPAGEVLTTSWNEMPWPWDEVIEAAVLVYLPDRITVANVQPRTTKCAGFKPLADALTECQKPEWADKSPAHKAAMVMPQPMMRFYGEVTLGPVRTSKKSGLPYRVTQCVIKPVTNVEVGLQMAFAEDPKSRDALNDAAQRFQSRVAEVESKLKK